jgi:hypothetical protein
MLWVTDVSTFMWVFQNMLVLSKGLTQNVLPRPFLPKHKSILQNRMVFIAHDGETVKNVCHICNSKITVLSLLAADK